MNTITPLEYRITPLELAQLAAYIAKSEGIAANSDHVAIAAMLVEKSAEVIAGWRSDWSSFRSEE
jgi:hypothetical protein